MKTEQTRNFYTLATDSNPELENDNVPNDNDYYCNKQLQEITGKLYDDFISIVSYINKENNEKLSIKSELSKQKNTFLKGKVKSLISGFKFQGDLNGILVKGNMIQKLNNGGTRSYVYCQ